jgi:hypothetical protein
MYSPDMRRPAVDFTRHTLFVAAGPSAGPGDSLRLKVLYGTKKELAVSATVYHDCMPVMINTMPIAILRMPKAIAVVRVKEELVAGPFCP